VVQQLSSPGQNSRTPFSFSPDGHDLVVTETNPKTLIDVLRLHLNGSSEAEQLLNTTANETWGQISPDGHWMAYYSDESGRGEVYVRPYPKVDGGRWLISTDGGSRPVWSRNGRELFYSDPNSAMMVATVQTSPVFSPGKPIKLFDQTITTLGAGARTYDVSPDGRFLLIKPGAVSDRSASPTINVVVNWTEELKQRVPTK
jgi:serine/threonine-protein kinase